MGKFLDFFKNWFFNRKYNTNYINGEKYWELLINLVKNSSLIETDDLVWKLKTNYNKAFFNIPGIYFEVKESESLSDCQNPKKIAILPDFSAMLPTIIYFFLVTENWFLTMEGTLSYIKKASWSYETQYINCGNQIFLSEIQALVEKSDYSYPKRVITSFKSDRFDILIAIMKNKLKTTINDKDIYVNIINNTKFNSSDTFDLPILASIISKISWISTGKKVFIWRIWLLGEIRTVSWQDDIIKKLKNLWFTDIVSSDNCKNLEDLRWIIIGVSKS